MTAFIIHSIYGTATLHTTSSEPITPTASTVLKDFPLLSAKLAERNVPNQSSTPAADGGPLRSHLNQCISDITHISIVGLHAITPAIEFLHRKHETKMCSVTLIAQDFMCQLQPHKHLSRDYFCVRYFDGWQM